MKIALYLYPVIWMVCPSNQIMHYSFIIVPIISIQKNVSLHVVASTTQTSPSGEVPIGSTDSGHIMLSIMRYFNRNESLVKIIFTGEGNTSEMSVRHAFIPAFNLVKKLSNTSYTT